MQLIFFLQTDGFCLSHHEQSEKWSKVCILSLLSALFCNNYLSIFTILPIQLPYSNSTSVAKSVLRSWGCST